jgi:putative ATP-binding cassette transporter
MWKLLATLMRGAPLSLVGIASLSLLGGVASTAAVSLLVWKGQPRDDAPTLFALLCAVSVGARVTSHTTMKRLATKHLYGLRTRLCHRVSRLTLRQLDDIGPNRLHVTLTEDLGTLTNTYSRLGLIMGEIAILLAVVVYMAYLSILGCVLSLVAIAFVLAMVQAIARPAMAHRRRLRASLGELHKHFNALVFGAKELRMSDARLDAFLERGVRPTAAALVTHANGEGLLTSIAIAFSSLTLLVAMGVIAFGLPRFGITGVAPSFVVALLYASGPLTSFVDFISSARNAGVAFDSVESTGMSMAALQPEPAADPSRPRAERVELELDEVKYSYRSPGSAGDGDGAGFTVGPVDITIRSGEVAFIIGGNGSGKSTLLKLLVGLFQPDQGKVKLNGAVIGEADAWWFRGHFAVIFSDYHLLDHVWDPEVAARGDLANHYLNELGLTSKVRFENGRFTTTNLSTGQRKRLALVAALMEDRPIYAFDEWAADQDPFYRRMFYERIIPKLKAAGKAVIAITHDERYFPSADFIIKLEDGRRVDGETGLFLNRLTGGRSTPPPA